MKLSSEQLFNKILNDKIEQARRAKSQAKYLDKFFRLVDFQADKYGMEKSIYAEGNNVYIYLNGYGFDGLKDPKVADILQSWVWAEPDAEDTEDYPASMRRDYRFSFRDRGEDGTLNIIVRVGIEFKADSPTCKKVIVGYQEVPAEPQPIYALRCEGDGEELKA